MESIAVELLTGFAKHALGALRVVDDVLTNGTEAAGYRDDVLETTAECLLVLRNAIAGAITEAEQRG